MTEHDDQDEDYGIVEDKVHFGNTDLGENLGCAAMILALAILFHVLLR